MESTQRLRERNRPRIDALTTDQALAVYGAVSERQLTAAALRVLGLGDRTLVREDEIRAVLFHLAGTAMLTKELDKIEVPA